MDTIGFPIAFIVVVSFCLWIIIGARGHWSVKSLVIPMALYFSLSVWFSLDSVLGWPVKTSLPSEFQVYWVVVEEPNLKTRDKGRIYIWLKNLNPQETKNWFVKLHSKELTNSPRLYMIDYSREMHEKAEQINNEIKAGKRYFGMSKKQSGEGEEEGEFGDGKSESGGSGQDGAEHGQDQEGMIYDLPPVKNIPKVE